MGLDDKSRAGGRRISRKEDTDMMKKKQSIAVLVIAVLVTALLGWTTIVGWGPTGTGAMKNINLGLDLS